MVAKNRAPLRSFSFWQEAIHMTTTAKAKNLMIAFFISLLF